MPPRRPQLWRAQEFGQLIAEAHADESSGALNVRRPLQPVPVDAGLTSACCAISALCTSYHTGATAKAK